MRAGRGGDGCVSFRREKYVPRGGPDGGDGGRGGNVWVAGSQGLSTLYPFTRKRIFKAGDGKPGGANKRSGKQGQDCLIEVPVGTEVYDAKTGHLLADILTTDRVLLARGGKGGRGNHHFATPSRQAPQVAEEGKEGEALSLRLELKLLSDVGLVGLPNAGKSTLLSAISRARPKVAPYPFTTKIPQLGVVVVDEKTQFVAADIPGLIEGASQGKGLGHYFLAQIERTRLLWHLVDPADPTLEIDQQIATVEQELKAYDPALLQKPRWLVLTKTDIPAGKKKAVKASRSQKKPVFLISAVTGAGVKELVQRAATFLTGAHP